MKQNTVLVKSVLMSIITAVTVSFTACTDDADLMNESAEAQVLNNEPKEPVGFIFNDFLTPEDIQILNADTTQISISKELADKKGIDNFVNRPMGIWLNLREASFLRRGTKQTLAGDRYIIDVVKAELAEVLPIGKDITLKTDVYVNPEALVNTATRGDEGKDLSQIMEEMSIDKDGCFHPVAIRFDEEMTRSSNMPDVYYSPLELLASASGQGQTRGWFDWVEDTWNDFVDFVSDNTDKILDIVLESGKHILDPFGIGQFFWDLCIDGNEAGNFTGELLHFKNNLTLKKDFKLGSAESDTISIRLKAPMECKVNYIINMKPGGSLANPRLDYFRACMDGEYKTSPELTIGLSKKIELPKDKQKIKIKDFPGKTLQFNIYGVPVIITITPNAYLKLKLKGEGYLYAGIKYDFASKFKVGAEYKDSKWHNLTGGEITKSEFKLTPIAATFSVNAGVGLMLGCDVKFYDVTGPYVAVGPQLAADMKLNVRPTDINPISITSTGKIGIWGEAGAKVEIWKWHIADYYDEFDFGKTWDLWNYPDKDKKQSGIIDALVKSLNQSYNKIRK